MHLPLLYSLEEALKFASASAADTGVLRLSYAQASRAASIFCVGFAVNSRALLKDLSVCWPDFQGSSAYSTDTQSHGDSCVRRPRYRAFPITMRTVCVPAVVGLSVKLETCPRARNTYSHSATCTDGDPTPRRPTAPSRWRAAVAEIDLPNDVMH